MRCPRCDSPKTRVVDSREGGDGRSVRRRRECEVCEFRYTTFERLEESLPMVIKKGGQRESFDRYKVLSGLRKACEKRPVSVMDMEDVVRCIEAKLLESGEKEIPSKVIGELVIERLHELDQVAYVRFASVYREFSDIGEFMETLRTLVGQRSDVRSVSSNLSQSGNTGAGVTDSSTCSVGNALNVGTVIPFHSTLKSRHNVSISNCSGNSCERDSCDSGSYVANDYSYHGRVSADSIQSSTHLVSSSVDDIHSNEVNSDSKEP